MDSRRPTVTVAQRIRAAIQSTGNTAESVAEATAVPLTKLLNSPTAGELTVEEVARVGGFLHVAPASFFEGVTA
jgi:hypothetical protein